LTAVIIGGGAYFILSRLQDRSQREQYHAITTKIESSTLGVVLDKQDALTTGMALALQKCPKEQDWPECDIPFNFYQSILNPLYRITQVRTISTTMVVKPSEVTQFEDFAYDFFERQGHPELGISPFGKGIFAINETTGQRFHDTTGTTGHGKRRMLLAVLQVTDLPNNKGAFMHNSYSETTRIQALDYVFDCVEKHNESSLNCTAITGIVFLAQDSPATRPSALTYMPIILPGTRKIVGVMAAVHNWDLVLKLGSNEEVDGIMAVLSDGIAQYTYLFSHGEIIFYGEGDLHDHTFDYQRVSFAATPFDGPVRYTVSLYPTQQWMKHYLNDFPLIACLVMVGLVIFTSIVFSLYDFLMNREAVHQDLIMQTKRQYVRYISHEIRTPLNVVHLGFQVLFVEMTKIQERLKGSMLSLETESKETVSTQILDRMGSQSYDSNAETRVEIHRDRSNSSQSIAQVADVWITTHLNDWLDLVHDIVDSLNAAIAVLNDLIDYDKIDSGTMTLQQELLPVWTFVETCLHPFIVQARAKDVEMELQLDPEMESTSEHQEAMLGKQQRKALTIFGDRVKLSQVLRNLISNALKFTSARGHVTVMGHWDKSMQSLKTIPSSSGTKGWLHGRRCCSKRKSAQQHAHIYEQANEELASKFEPAGQVVLTVRDTGAGISATHLQELFQEGVQFNPNNLQAGQGSGLGLWITKGIVDAHGGQLSAGSEGEGQGTMFTLTLPVFLPLSVIVSDKQPELLIEDQKAAVIPEHSSIQGDAYANKEDIDIETVPKIESVDVLLESKACKHFPHVLVVDDSAVNRKMMCRSLQSVGFTCFQAIDGLECVKIVEKVMKQEYTSIDLILMDYEMPGMNGPTACATLLAMDCNIPVIGVTGNVLNEDKQVFLNHGAIEVLQKPFLITTLESILQRIVENQRKARTNISD
jgi:signal transduction histidine kinase/CheY-like chemotaxis protein